MLNRLGEIFDCNQNKLYTKDEILLSVSLRSSSYMNSGVRKGDVVVLTNLNSIDFFLDLFSLWNLGAIAFPYNAQTSEELDKIIDEFKIKKTISYSQKTTGSISTIDQIKFSENNKLLAINIHEDNEGLILMTSGTTGKRKAVVFKISTLLYRIKSIFNEFLPGELDRTLCFLSTSFGHGLIANCLTPLLNGNRLYIHSKLSLGQVYNIKDIIESEKITYFSSIPTFWRMILKAGVEKIKINSLKRIHCASEPLSENIFHQIEEWTQITNIRNVYGLTEMGSWVSIQSSATKYSYGQVGTEVGAKIIVKDDANRECVDQVGNVYIQSEGMFDRFLDSKNLSNKKEFFHTGDLGIKTKEGSLFITGRNSDIINSGGKKIIASELKSFIEGIVGVIDVHIMGIPHEIFGEIIGAALVIDSKIATLSEIQLEYHQKGAHLPQPSKWLVLNEFPQLSTGKIDREKLKKLINETN